MSEYIYQTSSWQKFWTKVKDSNHQSSQFTVGNFTTKIYQYPWILKQKVWFLPACPVYLKDSFEGLEKEEVLREFLEFLNKLKQEAQKNKISILKFYLEPKLGGFLNIQNQAGLLNLLQKTNSKFWIKGSKSFMYEQIMQLQITDLKLPEKSFELNDNYLGEFFKINQNFWLERNKTIRNQTKRSLSNNWLIDNQKTTQNIELSYQILLETAQRQGFGLPSEEYFKELANQNFSHFWLLKNQSQEVVSTWIGLNLGSRLVNLYGGNRGASFTNFGPNYLHLAGIGLAKDLGLDYYDFGGYNKDETTAKFKDSYKGEIVTFPGNLNLGVSFLGKILSRFC
jgi:hypothetical protein